MLGLNPRKQNRECHFKINCPFGVARFRALKPFISAGFPFGVVVARKFKAFSWGWFCKSTTLVSQAVPKLWSAGPSLTPPPLPNRT